MTKRLVMQMGIRTALFLPIEFEDWRSGHEPLMQSIQSRLKFPMWVKPANLGSSIGVRRADNQVELFIAIDRAFRCDHKILVEEHVEGRQIEFAVLGFDRTEASLPGEIKVGEGFYDYEAKYITDDAQCIAPADLSLEQIEEGRELARNVYVCLGCSGLARVDFFLDEAGRYWLNEVNPMPGMTQRSLYPAMWEASGVSRQTLWQRLIATALRMWRSESMCRM
ncbi:MAG: ATP-grasp domain-containing protein, partial [Chlamydiia bacterium]|nr:ATP-grasp domain-containing protein [Chlamydiia bacterium]